jgi:threonylcarbamoyladenosine tRNA methylthiotransferase MtaB
MSKRHTFTIRTLGCKANQYDTQLLRENLLRRGLVECPGDGDADVCIINTCTVTAHSDTKSRHTIRALKRHNPNARIVVTGCYAHNRPEEILAIPAVDAVLGNSSKPTLPEQICALLNHHENLAEARPPAITFFSNHTRAFVKIQDGCDKRCSYCTVRFARGESRSRSIPDVLREIKGLVDNGYKEVVLTGIHIGSFGVDDNNRENRLPELIERLRPIEGLLRVRLSSIDPNEITPPLIEAVGSSPQVCRHLHMPLQSGCNAVLRKMNREYTRDQYLQIVSLLRNRLPGLSLTTDVMVGFPGETDKDFQESLSLVSQVQFGKVHIFPFSPRPATPADRFPNRIPRDVIKRRIAALASEADAAASKARETFLGQAVEILVERKFRPRREKNLPDLVRLAETAYEGFSSNYFRTVLVGSADRLLPLKNRVVSVSIEAFDEHLLYGRPR